MKIIMIGPVYPFKGGISHYTGLMYNELRKKHNVDMISFKMQYPKILFKKEQRDYSNEVFKIENTKFLINTANPINWILSSINIRKAKSDAIIIQWWHPYFAPCYYFLRKILGRKKILYVCHNVFPHERFPMDRFLVKKILRHGDYFIVHSHQDEQDLLSVNAHAKYVVTPHPTYNAFNIEGLSLAEARSKLDIAKDTKVILFFGFVREYKGLKHLLHAMPCIRERLQDIQLWIVGEFGDDKQDYLEMIAQLNIRRQIRIIEGYIPDKDVEKYFAAADLVVLPYESATQSGIVQIAYGFEKPVVVTNVGGLPEVVDNGKTGYVVERGNSKEIAEAIIDYYKEDKYEEFKRNIKEKDFSWATMVRRIEECLEM